MVEIKQSFAQLFDQLQGAQLHGFKTPPIAQWHPRKTQDIDMRIAADGRWYYQGTVIERSRMVKLFGALLRLESDGIHYLVTPHVKYPIAVDDAPFQAVELNRQGLGQAQNLIFRTNVDDVVVADAVHPICIITSTGGQPSPYIEVRNGLRAKISRAVYYELAHMIQPAEWESDRENNAAENHAVGNNSAKDNFTEDNAEVLGVYSAGVFFPFGCT